MPRSRPLSLAAALALLAGAPAALHAQPAAAVPEIIVRAPAPAPPGTEVRSETVKYGDLDIARAAGAETLLTRIRAAAGRVCAPAPDSRRALADTADHTRCVDGAIQRAVAGVNAPQLTQAYRRGHG